MSFFNPFRPLVNTNLRRSSYSERVNHTFFILMGDIPGLLDFIGLSGGRFCAEPVHHLGVLDYIFPAPAILKGLLTGAFKANFGVGILACIPFLIPWMIAQALQTAVAAIITAVCAITVIPIVHLIASTTDAPPSHPPIHAPITTVHHQPPSKPSSHFQKLGPRVVRQQVAASVPPPVMVPAAALFQPQQQVQVPPRVAMRMPVAPTLGVGLPGQE